MKSLAILAKKPAAANFAKDDGFGDIQKCIYPT